MALSLPADASRRDFLRITGLGAVGLALAACGGGGGSTAAPASSAAAAPAAGQFGDISVQLSWIKNIEFGGEYFADSKGYYSEAGFNKVDLVTGPVDSADALVLAGNITVGVSAPDATARFITEQGGPLKIIGNTFQKNPFCILSLEEGKPIRTPADLVGKTSASRPAPTSDLRRLPEGEQHRPGLGQPGRRAVRADPADREEGRRFHGLPDQRAVHRQGSGLHPRHAGLRRQRAADDLGDVHRAAGDDRHPAGHAQGLPDRRDPRLDRRGGRPGRRGQAGRRDLRQGPRPGPAGQTEQATAQNELIVTAGHRGQRSVHAHRRAA